MNRLSAVNPYVWIGLIMLLSLLVRSYHLAHPIYDMHAFRQTQTAGLIRDYYKDGIDLLYPRMITLGDPGYVVLEFPLYQALASLLYKFISPDVILARLLSIFSGLLSILFVYRISNKYLDQQSAIFAALIFSFVPLNMFYSRVPMPDALTILLSLLMLYFLIEGTNNKTLFLIYGIAAASLGLIIKSPYVGPLYLPLIYAAYKEGTGLKTILSVRFLATLAIPIAVMVLWQRHANHVNEMYFQTNNYPFKALYSAVVVKLYPFNKWYFGSMGQRLQLVNYMTLWGRIQKDILAYVGVLFLPFGLMALAKKRQIFFYIWLASSLISTMIFFNVNRIHNYYQLPLAAILSIFCGAGITYMSQLIKNLTNKKVVGMIMVSLALVYIIMSLVVLKDYHRDSEGNRSYIEVGKFIDMSIEKNALIATVTNKDDYWWPVLMYYSDRHGFTLSHKMLNSEMIAYFKSKGIKFIALVDYKDKEDMRTDILAPYKITAENDRVKIYNLSYYEN